MSLKAGGCGINLTSADTVILYEPWWNPAVGQQAEDRVYRIGQNKNVTVYHLILHETMEEKILELQNRKQEIANILMKGEEQVRALDVGNLKKLILGEEGMRKSNMYKFYHGCLVILILMLAGLTVYYYCKSDKMEAQYEIMLQRVDSQDEQVQCDKTQDKIMQDKEIEGKVSIMLSVISAGIAVFALFGGFLSLVTLSQAKDLNEAIQKAERYSNNQQELLASSYLQEGRNYHIREKDISAKENYERAIHKAHGTLNALIAKYEIGMLYAEVPDGGQEVCEKAQQYFEEFLKELDAKFSNSEEYILLKCDALFAQACCYGNLAEQLSEDEKKNQYREKAIEHFKNVLKYKRYDVDTHRNLSLSYALLGNIDACRTHLDKAIEEGEGEPLDKSLVTKERLSRLYRPYIEGDSFNHAIIEFLKEKKIIKNDDGKSQ